jgi:hypothetical protein
MTPPAIALTREAKFVQLVRPALPAATNAPRVTAVAELHEMSEVPLPVTDAPRKNALDKSPT